MNEEEIQITLDKTWADRFDRAAAVAESISDTLLRVAVAIERLAEYERQKLL